uniref:Uncharacterized protein n=1 Tax=Arundo donax TaxID=35708 RepID=A0A0A9A6L8_ARUDO
MRSLSTSRSKNLLHTSNKLSRGNPSNWSQFVEIRETETRHPGRSPAPTMADSESQSLPSPPWLPFLRPTSATVPAKQPAPPRGTSAGNRAAAAAAMDERSRLLPPPPESREEREGGVRGDGCGDAAGCFFFLPLGGMAAASGELQ